MLLDSFYCLRDEYPHDLGLAGDKRPVWGGHRGLQDDALFLFSVNL